MYLNDSNSWENNSLVARCTVSRDRAATAFLEWLAAYKYTPVDLLQPSLLDDVLRIYVPYYSFSVRYRADYSVSIGYHRVEHYTAHETVYENGKSRQVQRTKSRLVTDYHPYKNSIEGGFTESVPDSTIQSSRGNNVRQSGDRMMSPVRILFSWPTKIPFSKRR